MAGFPNYTYPAYGGYNPVTPFAPAPQIYQPMQQPSPQPVQAAQTVGNTNTQPNFFCRPVASREQPAENVAPAFAPLDEFMDMKDTINNLKDEIERLKKPVSSGKAGKKNDASDE